MLGFHTGLRLGSLKSLRWRDIDFDRAVATIARTKNGDPHIAPLTARCLSELNKLRKGLPDDLVFAGRTNRPYCHTKLWQHTVELAGLRGVTFHWLRHSCGAHLATSMNPIDGMAPKVIFSTWPVKAKCVLNTLMNPSSNIHQRSLQQHRSRLTEKRYFKDISTWVFSEQARYPEAELSLTGAFTRQFQKIP